MDWVAEKSTNTARSYFVIREDTKRVFPLETFYYAMILHLITTTMKHTFAIALCILRVIADIGESPDYDAFLLASNEELPNDLINDGFFQSSDGALPYDSINLFTEPLGDSLQSSANELIASTQPDCMTFNDNTDSLFLSRLRPRIDSCLAPLTPPPNIYDSNSILNQLVVPQTWPKIPGTEEKSDRQKLEEMFGLSDFDRDTSPGEQEDICPEELVKESQLPVCSSGRFGPDASRKPGDDFYTLYFIRFCTFRQIWPLLLMMYFINWLMKSLIRSYRVSAKSLRGTRRPLVLSRSW